MTKRYADLPDNPKQNRKALIGLTRNVSISQRIYDPAGVSATLTGLGGGCGAKTGLYVVQEDRRGGRRKGHRRYIPRQDQKSNCVTTNAGREYMRVTDGRRIRRLTPRETERLQGFPDDWTAWGVDGAGYRIELSDTARYKLTGNAVTTTVIAYLASLLKASLTA